MNFGKYRGRLVQDVDTDYLIWCLAECSCLRPWLRQAIELEVERHVDNLRHETPPPPHPPPQYPPPVDWPSVLRTWHRELALEYHPDRGGHPEAMKAINVAVDRLKQLVGCS
jgi:hypothetical protein